MRAGRWESPRKTWPVMVPVAGGGAEDWAGSKRETRMSRVRIRRTFTAIPQSAGAAWRLYEKNMGLAWGFTHVKTPRQSKGLLLKRRGRLYRSTRGPRRG